MHSFSLGWGGEEILHHLSWSKKPRLLWTVVVAVTIVLHQTTEAAQAEVPRSLR